MLDQIFQTKFNTYKVDRNIMINKKNRAKGVKKVDRANNV